VEAAVAEDHPQRLLLSPSPAAAAMVSASHSLLHIQQPLVPRANKPITTAELIKRLTSLFNQLSDAEQDNPALKAQIEKTVAPQLVDKNLIQHKDRGVRSYVAVCIVEVLRVCAPEAPFTSPQLKVRI
jgi:sister-chromatid-cohesion protein PDS5